MTFGETVAVMLNNRLECLWTWIGLSRIGAVHVGINTAYKGAFLTHVLTNTKSRFGVVEHEFLPWLADIEDTVPDLRTVYVPGGPLAPDDIPGFKHIEVRHFDELLLGPPDDIEVEITYRDTGMIMFTSGTTGPSKGVLMPHGHLYLLGHAMEHHMRMTPADRLHTHAAVSRPGHSDAVLRHPDGRRQRRAGEAVPRLDLDRRYPQARRHLEQRDVLSTPE